MLLAEFLKKYELTPEQFARSVEVHPTTIYRFLSGDTIPKKKNLEKILRATHGEVDANALFAPSFERQKEAANATG